MPLFIYPKDYCEACLKSLKTNVKTSTRYTCTTDLDLAYLLTQFAIRVISVFACNLTRNSLVR